MVLKETVYGCDGPGCIHKISAPSSKTCGWYVAYRIGEDVPRHYCSWCWYSMQDAFNKPLSHIVRPEPTSEQWVLLKKCLEDPSFAASVNDSAYLLDSIEIFKAFADAAGWKLSEYETKVAEKISENKS